MMWWLWAAAALAYDPVDYYGSVCLPGMTEVEPGRKVKSSTWDERLSTDQLPTALYPVDWLATNVVAPDGWYQDENGTRYSARQVADALFAFGPSHAAASRALGDYTADPHEQELSGLALVAGAVTRVSPEYEAQIEELSARPDDKAAQWVLAVCQYNAVHYAFGHDLVPRTRADQIVAVRPEDSPPLVAWLSCDDVYTALGRSFPSDAALWRKDVDAFWKWVSDTRSVASLVEGLRARPDTSIADYVAGAM